MAKGRPSKRASVTIKQEFLLDKTGMEIVIKDKYRAGIKGTLVISIGGLRWYGKNSKKRHTQLKWDQFSKR